MTRHRTEGVIPTAENEKTVDKRERILDEAVSLFYEKGYDNTSIRTLAEATGLSVAGIYYFFQDKEEILFELLKQAGEDLIESVSSSFDQSADPERDQGRDPGHGLHSARERGGVLRRPLQLREGLPPEEILSAGRRRNEYV